MRRLGNDSEGRLHRGEQYEGTRGQDPIREKLRLLESRSLELQKIGKYGESLDVLEEAFHLKINAYGEDSEEVMRTSEKLCELCNLIAMVCLTREKFEACYEFLKKATILSEHSLTFKAVTYNNLACYYRRTGKIRTALDYLKKALDLEIKNDHPQSLADTHLNLCAVLSQLDRHAEALEHVLMSIVLLQEEHMLRVMKQSQNNRRQDGSAYDPNNSRDENQQQQQQQQQQHEGDNNQEGSAPADDRLAVLAIAFHNMGVELEFLKRFEEAIQTYRKAVNFSVTYLGENHNLVENLRGVLANAEAQIQEQKNKDQMRKANKLDGTKKPSKRINQAATMYQQNDPNMRRATTAKSENQQRPQFRISSAQQPSSALGNSRNHNQYQQQQQQQQQHASNNRFTLNNNDQNQQQRPLSSNLNSRTQKNNPNYAYSNNQYDFPQNANNTGQPNYQNSQQQYGGNHNDMLNVRANNDNNHQDFSPDQHYNQQNS